ncbi:hypothetical protein PPERSA_04211 [Pseudocohnilembus persalinus]|uniref:Uncharacterized protein n=1 Tax=Pseudocohnilembus persalinus TaxID=266149 RepID=A0A0V0QN07_PSEPJ|nr:hypothetical protein PPERSA_04211 [Pseudocohnilembus persalinus]|eukprot:KRX03659.1 hypothetical protein PPERSA_04211 [Pseudocohnilembus persalinus]
MKKKDIVLTPLLGQKMYAQYKLLKDQDDQDQSEQSKKEIDNMIITQQATLDYNLKCNWSTYFYDTDLDQYIENCKTVQALLQSAPMGIITYLTLTQTGFNLLSTISLVSAILTTCLENFNY